MNPFSYSLYQVRKLVVSLVLFAMAIAAFFVAYDPNLTQALVVVVGALFAVIGVFIDKNHTADDLSKALTQLQGAIFAALGFIITVPASTEMKVAVVVGALISAYAVFRVPNGPLPTELDPVVEDITDAEIEATMPPKQA